MRPTTPYPRFHLALPVTDLDATRAFYEKVLGCRPGRSDARWVDLDFFGHQLVLHLVDPQDHPSARDQLASNAVDQHAVPASHYGPILGWDEFQSLADQLRAAQVSFIIEPTVRFAGKAGEQATMFFADPSGNAIEMKAFRDINQLFATDLDADPD